MEKKKITFLINENLYDSFKAYCEKEGLKLSDKFEILLANELRKEGVNIKEYPTLTSIFKRIGFGEGMLPMPEKPRYIEPSPVSEQGTKYVVKERVVIEGRNPSFENIRQAGQDVRQATPVRSFEKVVEEVIKSNSVINPKRIISKKPVPTIDQLRARRGF